MNARVLRPGIAALLVAFATAALPATGDAPVASVTGGQVAGALLAGGGATFKGIPFAAPPVGALRWREPAPVVAWQGLRDATRFGASCVQEILAWNKQEATGNQEDCLYLNVWTPEWPARAKHPVMFWIHGGGHSGGGASVDYFDGASLASKGVVLVTINYRLGVLGFMSLPALAAESPHHASGNYGLLDEVAALKWVKANIARFGGDPGNVTIFGQSAGGEDVNLLLTTPLSQGLFHRAIEQSERPLFEMATRDEAQAAGERFVASLRPPAGVPVLEFLRGLPAQQLLQASRDARNGDAAPTMIPSADGWVLPEPAPQRLAAGKRHAVPLMIGSNAREQGAPKPEALRQAVSEAFAANAGKALAYYGLDAAGEGNTDPLYGPAGAQFAADARQRCGSVLDAIWHASTKQPVYYYQFDHPIAGRPATQHSAELTYVFGNLVKDGFFGGPYGDKDRVISNTLQAYWTNFARAGNPNGTGLPEWPRFDPSARAFLEFTDAGPTKGARLRQEICDLYIDARVRAMQPLPPQARR